MSDKQPRDDGGWAFPNAHFSDVYGMSLRDWFAGQTLISASSALFTAMRDSARGDVVLTDDRIVELQNSLVTSCYELADAMLEASKQ